MLLALCFSVGIKLNKEIHVGHTCTCNALHLYVQIMKNPPNVRCIRNCTQITSSISCRQPAVRADTHNAYPAKPPIGVLTFPNSGETVNDSQTCLFYVNQGAFCKTSTSKICKGRLSSFCAMCLASSQRPTPKSATCTCILKTQTQSGWENLE